MHELDTMSERNQSITATVCDQAALFGAIPDRDEFDSREVWDPENALSAVTEAFGIMARGVLPTEPSSPTSGKACSGGS